MRILPWAKGNEEVEAQRSSLMDDFIMSLRSNTIPRWEILADGSQWTSRESTLPEQF